MWGSHPVARPTRSAQRAFSSSSSIGVWVLLVSTMNIPMRIDAVWPTVAAWGYAAW